jgi:pimeloyl-ACP methyl ester carboxylesterase
MTVRRAVNAIAGLVARQGARRARPERHRIWDIPAADAATRVSFRFGLSGRRWGTQGPAVLMLHGRDGRPAQFRYLIEPLVASGRQVIALDGPAHGPALGSDASPMEYALAISEAAVELGALDAVAGHGTGAAAVALALANGLDAARAVLIAAPARDVTPLAPRLRVPALIVHDWDDPIVPFADGEAIAQAWPGARLLATSGLGHWRILTAAAVTQGVSEFLAGHAAGLTAAQLRALAEMS